MDKEKIIPEVIDKAPKEVAEVSFSSGGKVYMGDILTPTQGKFFRYFQSVVFIVWEFSKRSTHCKMDCWEWNVLYHLHDRSWRSE